MNNEFSFKVMQQEDILIVVSAFSAIGWSKPANIFENYLQEQNNNKRRVWLAFKDNDFAGYVTLKWASDYQPFFEKNIPEINDLNVLPHYRNRGLGSKLLDLAENYAKTKSQCIGIGVGLYADYGNAQRLYVKRGYVPDGNGITYNNQTVFPGSIVTVDDNLVLWFVKENA